jgi:hypothetical protein
MEAVVQYQVNQGSNVGVAGHLRDTLPQALELADEMLANKTPGTRITIRDLYTGETFTEEAILEMIEQQKNKLAKMIVDIASGEQPNAPPKNEAAVELGRKGGKKRAESMSPERRAEIARKAAEKRWKK